MKRITNLAILALLGLSSCTQEFTYDPTQEIKENAENIFGLIDPNQDWRTTTSGTVTVTANAPLSDIAKVQILTESPFFNRNARILAEAEATAGQTVTLSYDAPRELETLVAACVDSKGHHFIKAFDPGTTKISFAETTAKTRGVTRADDNIDVSGLTLDASTAQWTINSLRTVYAHLAASTNNGHMMSIYNDRNIKLWENTGWENETSWKLTANSTINGWNIVEGAVVRNVGDMSADEKKNVKAIFDTYLSRGTFKYNNNTYKEDNLEDIRESSAVKFFNNHLTSQGLPITLTPVLVSSDDQQYYEVFYYYYNPSAINSSPSENDYIRQLPKYKAMHCPYTLDAFGGKSNNFAKHHEYLLPYYGDDAVITSGECTTDGKVYRIRNKVLRNNKYNYMTYNAGKYNPADRMMEESYNTTDSRYPNQLWQIFNTSDGKQVFYNIGAGRFLIAAKEYVEKSNPWGTFYTEYQPAVKRNSFYLEKVENEDYYHIWYDKANNRMLGSHINPPDGSKSQFYLSTEKNLDNGEQVEWYLDKIEGYDGNKLENLTLEGEFVTGKKAVSATIPSGYKVGFMLRRTADPLGVLDKNGNIRTMEQYIRTGVNGCIWGIGELNTQVNQTKEVFKKSTEEPYTMKVDDPRIAMFNANNKTYLSVEDGVDCNFSDIIIEVGGNAGVLFDDTHEVEEQAYTMCFEDRPNTADYDMNDVVLRCVRKPDNKFELTLIATGAQDQVYIKGIPGTFDSGTDLNDKEVHELFGVPSGTFVNTETSTNVVTGKSAIYIVSEDMTELQFLSSIYISNYSMNGNQVHIPNAGEAPFAIIMPGDFDYPAERISIVDAYPAFSSWSSNANNYGNWPESIVESNTYTNPFNRKKTE